MYIKKNRFSKEKCVGLKPIREGLQQDFIKESFSLFS